MEGSWALVDRLENCPLPDDTWLGSELQLDAANSVLDSPLFRDDPFVLRNATQLAVGHYTFLQTHSIDVDMSDRAPGQDMWSGGGVASSGVPMLSDVNDTATSTTTSTFASTSNTSTSTVASTTATGMPVVLEKNGTNGTSSRVDPRIGTVQTRKFYDGASVDKFLKDMNGTLAALQTAYYKYKYMYELEISWGIVRNPSRF